jgi:hypothetical protein
MQLSNFSLDSFEADKLEQWKSKHKGFSNLLWGAQDWMRRILRLNASIEIDVSRMALGLLKPTTHELHSQHLGFTPREHISETLQSEMTRWGLFVIVDKGPGININWLYRRCRYDVREIDPNRGFTTCDLGTRLNNVLSCKESKRVIEVVLVGTRVDTSHGKITPNRVPVTQFHFLGVKKGKLLPMLRNHVVRRRDLDRIKVRSQTA